MPELNKTPEDDQEQLRPVAVEAAINTWMIVRNCAIGLGLIALIAWVVKSIEEWYIALDLPLQVGIGVIVGIVALYIVNVELISRNRAAKTQKGLKLESSWKDKSSEDAPKCRLMDVEDLRNGRKCVLWRVSPDGIDFSDTAKEPVLSYLILK